MVSVDPAATIPPHLDRMRFDTCLLIKLGLLLLAVETFQMWWYFMEKIGALFFILNTDLGVMLSGEGEERGVLGGINMRV